MHKSAVLAFKFLLTSLFSKALARRRRSEQEPALPGNLNVPSDMPTEHTNMIREKYTEYLKEKEQQKESQQLPEQKQDYFRPPEGMSPMKLGLKRDQTESTVELTEQVVAQLGITTSPSSLKTWLFILMGI